MDSLTHLLVGHAMGAVASSLNPKASAAVYWAAMIGNSAPDIDVPISLIFRRDIKMHRTITHTIPGILGLTGLTAAAIWLCFPTVPFRLIFAWALLGNLTHLAMDCLNLFGAKALWPFLPQSIDVGVLHILDPWILVIVGLPTLAAKVGLAARPALAASFFVIWPYVLYRIATARKLLGRLKREKPCKARIVPWFNSWRYIVETATAIEFGYWRHDQRRPLSVFAKEDSPLIRKSLTDPKVISFLRSAEYPYAQVEEGEEGTTVVWGDVLRQMRADFRPLKIRVGE